MNNFEFLTAEPKFACFTNVAIAAEQILPIDAASSAMNSRRAMEFAVKWMYSVDEALVKPYDDNLHTLLNASEFRSLVGEDMHFRLDYIRKKGNAANHTARGVKYDEALLCLTNLHIFLDFIARCYSDVYAKNAYDPELVGGLVVDAAPKNAELDALEKIKLEQLLKENAALKAELTEKRKRQHENYVAPPVPSEYETRKRYIDAMLQDAGWVEGKNWLNEYKVTGMPTKSGKGFADYALLADDGVVLAVVEAKNTCADVASGREQLNLYCDCIARLPQQKGWRPVGFLTNGLQTRVVDHLYPERKCATIYSKRDLEKLQTLRYERASLKGVEPDRNIAGRYYQIEAVKKVCEAFEKNARKALLVMATGSGKTRTIASLCDVLLKRGWVKNILFLADRTSLVTQAQESFNAVLPYLSGVNLCEDKDDTTARCVFSTYQTMMNCIDSKRTEDGDKLFTCGHFDLLICDEAHRSIYNKYRDIFNYFDAPLVGLTATPKDEIDKNTYEVFELDNGVPTYGYDLAQAVADGHLVNYVSIETQLDFMQNGIVYDALSPEQREQYEETFLDEDGEVPESIAPAALNEYVFNKGTIREVLNILMKDGIYVDYGRKIGKTIIFAKNHAHAEKILEVFNEEFKDKPGMATVIDNRIRYADNLIRKFKNAEESKPQIAISVDMLDTGIDVPSILNLVFFKKVMSKSKFWQMIGRGTRKCDGLIDGADKDRFLIFDFCQNFNFFRMNQGSATPNQLSLQGATFCKLFEIAFILQRPDLQVEPLIERRKEIVRKLTDKIAELDRNNFAVHQHLEYVDRYSDPDKFNALTYQDVEDVRREIAPLVLPDDGEPEALRFDALMFDLELATLDGKRAGRAKKEVFKKAQQLANIQNIPAILARQETIEGIVHKDELNAAGVDDFERIRKDLRDLIAFIPKEQRRYDVDFRDSVLSTEWNESELENDDLKNYKDKANFYIRQHQDEEVVARIKNNLPLRESDLQALERVLWNEIGTKEDYESEYGDLPLGEFVRGVVGLDMSAAKEAFARFLDETNFNSDQIYFVNQIVEYIVHNGLLKQEDFAMFSDTPFSDRGSPSEIFGDDLNDWRDIVATINSINANATVA